MQVKLVRNSANTGYAGGNNLGFQHAKGDLIVILNPDLAVDRQWLVGLLDTYSGHENAGIVCSNVLLYDKRDTINACGNDIHVSGLVFSRFYMEKECRCADEDRIVAAPTGASMLFSREKLLRIGRKKPFDSDRFTMEYSDIDLAIDFLCHGLLCFVSPSSKVYHKYRFRMSSQRLYRLEIGRYQLLGHISNATLSRMRRALILTEFMIWYYIFTKRQDLIGAKIRAQFWKLGHATARQDNSLEKDLKILSAMTPDVSLYAELDQDSSKTTRVNRTFHAVKESTIEYLRKSIPSDLGK